MNANRPAPSSPRAWRPFAIVAAVGLALAVLQFALDDRDPLVFTIPILVLTSIVLVAMALSGRGDRDPFADVEARDGLVDDGIRPLPPVPPILEDVRPTRVLSGQLYEDGPWVRVAHVRGELVAITDAPSPVVDEQAAARLGERGHRAAIAEGLLVVAAPGVTTPRELLAITRELHARL
jgi:hypothetical protein